MSRCTVSSTDCKFKIDAIQGKLTQSMQMLEAIEKSSGRLFATRIYEEDKAILKAKIVKYALLKQTLLKQCVN